MRKLLSILLLACLLSAFGFTGGYGQLYVKARTLTTAQGLSAKQVTCFYHDRKGFMWIGTRNGLNRYDGHSFKIYRPGPTNAISNEVINDIAEDSKGRIWVATMEGLNMLDPSTGEWKCIIPGNTDSASKGLPNFIVWDINIDQNDMIWLAPDVFEFCNYDYRTGKFTYYDWPSFAYSNPVIRETRYHSIQRFVKKNDHEYWLATTNGLVTLDINTKSFIFWEADIMATSLISGMTPSIKKFLFL